LKPSPTRPLGSLIKRLDIYELYDHPKYKAEGTLRNVLRLTPNLKVLTVLTASTMVELPYIPPSLEYLSTFYDESKSTHTDAAIVESNPRLRYIDFISSPSIHPSPTPNWYASLTGLSLVGLEECRLALTFPPTAFPNLRYIRLSDLPWSSQSVESFLRLHGASLHTLHMSAGWAESGSSPTNTLNDLLSFCPNLQELRLSCSIAPQSTFERFHPTPWTQLHLPMDTKFASCINIERLSVENAWSQWSRKLCTQMFDWMLTWIGREDLSSLKRIQFFSEMNARHLQQKHANLLAAFVEKCAQSGVVVVDHFERNLKNAHAVGV